MTVKPGRYDNQWEVFFATFVQELIAMPDELVLQGDDADKVRAHGLELLKRANNEKGRE